MRLKRRGDSREFELELIVHDTGEARVSVNGRDIVAALTPMADGSIVVAIGGRRVRVTGVRRRDAILAAAGPLATEFVAIEERGGHRAGGLAAPEIDAPMPGKVLKVMVSEGQAVETGDALVVLEAMKMETTLYAESSAIVGKICVAPGQMVEHGTRLIELTPAAVPAKPSESQSPDE